MKALVTLRYSDTGMRDPYNTRANLECPIWDYPLYSGSRQRAIASLPPEWRQVDCRSRLSLDVSRTETERKTSQPTRFFARVVRGNPAVNAPASTFTFRSFSQAEKAKTKASSWRKPTGEEVGNSFGPARKASAARPRFLTAALSVRKGGGGGETATSAQARAALVRRVFLSSTRQMGQATPLAGSINTARSLQPSTGPKPERFLPPRSSSPRVAVSPSRLTLVSRYKR
ncbi:hypothetical protein HPB50_000742 [Hyalomma asiaticum]|uniref:Uncharacterized protein n=1 Tax=Hyalomma asiaticum TaxID=266040 RepID=A0ACB7SJ85_HYAAI|nr:hypothetical protein HPB50_000742 [Hyalomma asiaticum]